MPKSARDHALEAARDAAIAEVFQLVEDASADAARRGVGHGGYPAGTFKWLGFVADAVANRAIEFDGRLANLELDKLQVYGQCDNPFAEDRFNELVQAIRLAVAHCLSRICNSPYGHGARNAAKGEFDRLKHAADSVIHRVTGEYMQLRAEFEVRRDMALAERRKTSAGAAQPPAATSAEHGQAEASPQPPVQTNANGHATAEQPPASGAGEQTKGDGIKKASGRKPKPSEQKAYFAWLYAESKLERKLTAREAWDYLREYGIDDSALVGELAGYTLAEKYSTFEQQASRGRNAVEQPKNTSRADRPIGRSIVSGDKIEFGGGDDAE